MDFSDALKHIKRGFQVFNTGWNGRGMFLEMQVPDEHSKMGLPYIYINMPNDHPLFPAKMVPWTPSQLDLMSDGWEVVNADVV